MPESIDPLEGNTRDVAQPPAATTYATWVTLLHPIRTIQDAEDLAHEFAANLPERTREPDFWTHMGVQLLADYLFAAAHAGRHLLAVYEWLGHESSPAPARLLTETHPEIAARIVAVGALNERVRAGIYFTARAAIAEHPSEDRAATAFDAAAAEQGLVLSLQTRRQAEEAGYHV